MLAVESKSSLNLKSRGNTFAKQSLMFAISCVDMYTTETWADFVLFEGNWDQFIDAIF